MRRAVSFVHSLYCQRTNRPTLPRFLTYLVTFSCNARCVMCDSWRKSDANDLTLSEIHRIFEQLPRMDAVRLSGGEPFLRSDILEIAHAAQKMLRPMFLHVTTNGFLTRRIVKFCERRRKEMPLYLLLSLDGVGEKHNAIRGRDTAWNMAMATLQALAPRQKELRLKLMVNQTIVDADGAEQYLALRGILRPHDIPHHLVMGYDTSATYHRERAALNVAPTGVGEFSAFGEFEPQQIERLLSEAERDARQYPFFVRKSKQYYFEGIRQRLLHQQGTPNPKCVALTAHLRIFPDGSVPTCQFNSHSVGNLRHDSFLDIWHGEAIQAQRKWVRRCPGCWAECEALPNAVYSGDLFKKMFALNRPHRF